MKNFFVLSILFAFFTTRSQDSTSTFPRHEFGFNSVWLVKNLTGSTTDMSDQPYVIFYNYYFHPKLNARFGFGGANQNSDTKGTTLVGRNEQLYRSVNARLGASYSLLTTSKLTINLFADGVYYHTLEQTMETSTVQANASPGIERTLLSTYKQNSIGGQAGMGVKYNLLKNLSLYAEIPVTWVYVTSLNESTLRVTDEEDVVQNTKTKGYSSWVLPPTTIYLVLRF